MNPTHLAMPLALAQRIAEFLVALPLQHGPSQARAALIEEMQKLQAFTAQPSPPAQAAEEPATAE